MKKLTVIVLCVVLCLSVLCLTACGDGVNIQNYTNEVTIEEFQELITEAITDYKFDDSDTFEKSYTIDIYGKQEEIDKYTYDSDAVTENRCVSTSKLVQKYDSVNKVINATEEYSEETKSPSANGYSKSSDKSWYQKDGNDVAYSHAPETKMYVLYEDSEITEYTKLESTFNNYYSMIEGYISRANNATEGTEYTFYVDNNIFTIVVAEQVEMSDTETSTDSTIQIIFNKDKVELLLKRETVETKTYADSEKVSTDTTLSKTTITIGNVTLNKEDLSKYNKYE